MGLIQNFMEIYWFIFISSDAVCNEKFQRWPVNFFKSVKCSGQVEQTLKGFGWFSTNIYSKSSHAKIWSISKRIKEIKFSDIIWLTVNDSTGVLTVTEGIEMKRC